MKFEELLTEVVQTPFGPMILRLPDAEHAVFEVKREDPQSVNHVPMFGTLHFERVDPESYEGRYPQGWRCESGWFMRASDCNDITPAARLKLVDHLPGVLNKFHQDHPGAGREAQRREYSRRVHAAEGRVTDAEGALEEAKQELVRVQKVYDAFANYPKGGILSLKDKRAAGVRDGK